MADAVERLQVLRRVAADADTAPTERVIVNAIEAPRLADTEL